MWREIFQSLQHRSRLSTRQAVVTITTISVTRRLFTSRLMEVSKTVCTFCKYWCCKFDDAEITGNMLYCSGCQTKYETLFHYVQSMNALE